MIEIENKQMSGCQQLRTLGRGVLGVTGRGARRLFVLTELLIVFVVVVVTQIYASDKMA